MSTWLLSLICSPIHATWLGGAFLAQQPGFEQEVVTRTVYEGNGPERLLPYAFQSYLSVC